MNTIQLIYSFDEQAQEFKTIQLPEIMLKDKETFFAYITTNLTEYDKKRLCKISCCILGECTLPENHFYDTCNGKFWDIEIIHYMAKIWAIKSEVNPVKTPDMFPELFATN